MENIGIHITSTLLIKTFGYHTDPLEPEGLPGADGGGVGAHHQVELHGTVAGGFCGLQGVGAE